MMNSRIRFRFLAGLLAAGIGGLFLHVPGWLSSCGISWEGVAESYRQWSSGEQRHVELNHQVKQALRRIERKEQALADLLVGRISLLQAAFRFKEGTDLFPGEQSHCPFPGATQGEQYCRMVIQYVETHMRCHPETCDDLLLLRLREELEQLLASPECTQPEFIPLPVKALLDWK